jgi:hypothetical protein
LKRTAFLWVVLWVGIPWAARAQEAKPYLASAVLYISVDDWADIWLNGIPIRDSQPYTPSTGPFQKIDCIPEHLCYFHRDNILAIEATNAVQHPPPREDHAGVAYILRLTFSNGTQYSLSSNDAADHRAFYVASRFSPEPRGWHYLDFDDSGWGPAIGTGGTIPFAAPLVDPQNGRLVQFLSSTNQRGLARYPGERHLFRVRFSLDIDPRPGCSPGEPNAQSSAPAVRSGIPAPPPAYTAVPSPTMRWALPALPPRIDPQAAAEPLETRIRKPKQKLPPLRPKTDSTFVPRATAEPSRQEPFRIEPEQPGPPPLPALRPQKAESAPQTIVFGKPPVNIYIDFADGPGLYRLEVLDGDSRPIRKLYEKRVVAETDDWVEWDGRDDRGETVPEGLYRVVFSKDGRYLNDLFLSKPGPP